MSIGRPAILKSSRGQTAFTIAEVVMGVALVGIVFVSLLAGMSSGFAVTQVARENLRATQIMLERMEGLRLYNWNQLVYSNMIPANFTNYYYPLAGPGESKGITYTGTMVITNANMNPVATYGSRMRAVVVTINWTSGNAQRTRTMTTYAAQNGIQNYVFSN